jgi:hypothetical protein
VAKAKTIPVSVRLPALEVQQLDDMVARHPIIGSRHNLARRALRLGMEAITADPSVLLKSDAKRKA